MKFTFCQVSNSLINPPKDTLSEWFYDTFWQNKRADGYYKPEHFWELPTWIAEICYTLPGTVERELLIVEEQDIDLVPGSMYCLSVLDTNKDIVKHIIENNQQCYFVLGGYVNDFKVELKHVNAFWFDSIEELCKDIGFGYKYGTDYSLFAGTECIPRLTLSTGCTHRCKFCTVPNELCEKTQREVFDQVYSFHPLKFKLVYINDKTYGQASNMWMLDAAYHRIKYYNPAFEGFIVQTTAVKVNELPATTWEDNHIKVVEIGVETFNDDLLKRYRKPVREYDIEQAVIGLGNLGVKVITNIILGLPGEMNKTYYRTWDFLWKWSISHIYSLNIYTLAAYDNSDLGIEAGTGDTDELNSDRTFWTSAEREAYRVWSEKFYQLGLEIVG